MKNMLCLTVYECKGLEFDDVILYDFFCFEEIRKQQWELLNSIEVKDGKRKVKPSWLVEPDEDESEEVKEAYFKALRKFEFTGEGAEYEHEWVIETKNDTDPDEIARVYGKLCVELKFLYVAITRPKNRLFIYDSI